MRLFLLGATGSTGTHLIDLGLARGHTVTAFVRSPGKLIPRPGLRVVAGDPRDAGALAAAMPDHDVVLSCLGPRVPEAFRAITLMRDCAASTVAAMERARVRRLIIVSAGPLFPGGDWRVKLVRWMLANHYRDLAAMEEVVKRSQVTWTIVRAPKLGRGDDDAYRSEREAMPEDAWSMTYRALAACMLDVAEHGGAETATFGLAGKAAA
jgi:putative NADH-flavin reductase